MAKQTHTPGPWTHRPSPVEQKPYRCVYFSEKRDEPYSTSALLPSDARLIAAAPDLLDALEMMLWRYEVYKNDWGVQERADVERAKAVICKATGK